MLTPEEYKKLSVKKFTKAAGKYETDRAGVYRLCRHDYPPILEELRGYPFKTLLDAGCGTAPMLSLLTKEYTDAHFTGLDLTPEMIRTAEKKGLPNMTLVVGDCENMPFGDASFDVVINSQSCHHYPDAAAFFRSVYRVLKPGGILILRDMSFSAPLVFIANHVSMPLINRLGHGDVRVRTAEELKELAVSAGLTVLKAERRFPCRAHILAVKKA